MHFKDPMDVTCPDCGEKGSVPVAQLLNRESCCLNCKASWNAISDQMLKMAHEAEDFNWGVEFTILLEDSLHITIPDAAFLQCASVDELCRYIAGESERRGNPMRMEEIQAEVESVARLTCAQMKMEWSDDLIARYRDVLSQEQAL